MPLLPLEIPPGLVKTRSPNAAKGRYTDGDKVRFVNGLPEKWKGCRQIIDDAVSGKARGSVAWSNVFGQQNAAIGTHLKLYSFTGADTLTDITPIRASSTINNDPFAVVEDSTTVTVTDTSHGAGEGDFVTFDGATAGGGITIDGEYQIVSIIDNNTYTIEHSVAATSTDSTTGGAAVTAAYQISIGLADGVAGLGWGAGPWGEEEWSTPRTEGLDLEIRTWSLSEYGNELLANPSGGGLYLWEEATDATAEVVSNAPTAIRAMFVTGERFIFALGCLSVSPMTVKWPDRDDLTDWTPTAANTANERTLQSGSKLMAGCSLTDGVSLVWSDTSLYLFQYTGDAFVYSDRLMGTNCGLAAPLGFCKVNGMAFWISGQDFYMYAGGVVPIPNAGDVSDFVFADLDPDHVTKTWAEYDQFNGQVRWHYVSVSSPDGEPDKYVDVNIPGDSANIGDWCWTVGTEFEGGRTTGTIFRPQEASSIQVDTDGLLYSHNDSLDDDGAAMESYITYGLFALARGEQNVDIMGIVPDCERQVGNLDFEVFTKDRPNDADNFDEVTYTLGDDESIIDARVSGRHFSQTVRSNVLGGDFRLGIVSLEVQDAGERR